MNKHLFISIFVIFILSLNSLFAQNSPKEMEDRIAKIDNEIFRLTNKNEASSFALQDVSNFLKNARVFLDKKNKHEKEEKEFSDKADYYLAQFDKELVDEDRKWLLKEEMQKYGRLAYEKFQILADLDSEFRENGGMLSYFDKQCNHLDDLQKEYNRAISHFKFLKKEYDSANNKLNKLHIERQKLVNELTLRKSDFDKKKQFLEGCWVLNLEETSSVISIHAASSNGELVGVLRVNELDGYDDGQKMFTVYRMSYNSFQGEEYIWSEPDETHKTRYKKRIDVIITINSDGQSLSWTSDQTVTMSRCQ